MLTIEADEDGGCHRLIDDGIGLCTSKSRNVLVRIRDALNAVRETGLVGLTVEKAIGTVADKQSIRGVVCAVVAAPHGAFGDAAIVSAGLIVRRDGGKLEVWAAHTCSVVEPARPEKDTPSNQPPIGVRTACELLTRWLHEYGDPDKIESATTKFLADRRAAEPTP